MVAVLKPIQTRVLRRPTYVCNETNMQSERMWISDNLAKLTGWWNDLAAYDEEALAEDCDTFAEFCAAQYDIECARYFALPPRYEE
jgi:hypothetical protein